MNTILLFLYPALPPTNGPSHEMKRTSGTFVAWYTTWVGNSVLTEIMEQTFLFVAIDVSQDDRRSGLSGQHTA
jgi:hypothetical protein